MLEFYKYIFKTKPLLITKSAFKTPIMWHISQLFYFHFTFISIENGVFHKNAHQPKSLLITRVILINQ